MQKLRVGLYGNNGHQIQGALVSHPRAELAAVAGIPEKAVPEPLRGSRAVGRYATLAEMLAAEELDLVSLCSPRRADQPADAIRCLEGGVHVYAEKPAALHEEDLDAILAAAKAAGRRFHEMAHTAFDQPYLEMRRLVAEGAIGTVVQVLAQKSYPMHERRPQEEAVDGGLTRQAGVHALRFVEHVSGIRVASIQARETQLGNPGAGELRVASSMMMTLENGGVAAALANYCNPRGFGSWGNETLRLWGTEGFLEATDGGTRTRLVQGTEDRGAITIRDAAPPYHDRLFASLQGEGEMPLSSEEELHPTRMVIRARASTA